jgi:ubiquitin-protein ligase E3 C
MYQSFTGASRRPRQVNLSGKNANPFAASNPLGGPQSAVQNAHQDRQQRQKQRQELNAAKTLQRVWRGHDARTKTRDGWRKQWDATNASHVGAIARLNALLLFFSPSNHGDVERLISFVSDHSLDTTAKKHHLRLEEACLEALAQPKPHRVNDLLTILSFLATAIPHDTARISNRYYTALSRLPPSTHTSFQQAVVAPLNSHLLTAYQGFASAYLTTPLETTTLDHLASTLDFSLLAQAIANVSAAEKLDTRRCLWLLGQFIYLKPQNTPTSHYVPVVAHMLSSLAEVVAPEAPALDMTNKDYDRLVLTTNPTRVQLNSFLRDQLSRLVDRDAISSLVPRPIASSETSMLEDTSDSQLLASYALILLRIFPLRADDIRMWLYVGPLDQAYREDTIPAITFFWKGMRSTSIFTSIHKDPRAAVELLKAPKASVSAWKPPGYEAEQSKRNEEWRVVLVFLELYTFVLKITDDEEFLGASSGSNLRESKNALPIEDLKDLTIFLKNMGFSMYFNSQEISESFEPSLEPLSTANLSRHFGGKSTTVETKAEAAPQTISVAGTVGMSLDYVKGLVTGLLRAVYDRDSRRNFLPKGHWLMTSRLDMTNFITAVVSEDERRQQLQLQAREEDGEPDEPDADLNEVDLISMTPSQRHYQRSNRQASTVRYLQSVAPRLEILQNMPFMIPFETRVEIFRQFVSLDMIKRRHGHTDPDLWRHRMAFGSIGGADSAELGRHHASIRRKNEFEDAFKQFYSLGDGLKEPIQITFLDEFGLQEAGIDGGGVTKEFLTSITTEAFNPEKLLFTENSQHALYPNPTSVEVHKEMLRLLGHSDDTEEHRESVRDLLQRYEFLGRVVGKCLYEGILIDINFASFFLSKWALFGGHNNASKESGYKASVNELRDLDEELYQGLMSLKHYPGDVAEWGTYFAVNNTITLPNGQTKTMEHNLIANGSNTLVNRGNRLVYMAKVAQYRLSVQSHLQTSSFLTGLSSIIQPSWLNMFNQKELQTLVGGAATPLDISDLRAHTTYNGVYEIGTDGLEHPSIQLFWSIMLELPDAERRKVLKFVTSTPRAPLLGFGSLNPRFTIRDAGDDEKRFPTASTCVNLLKLPRFRSKEALRERLLYAVNSGAGFDLS